MSFEQDTYHRINQVRAQLGHRVVMPDDFPPMGELRAKLQDLKHNPIAKALAGEMLRWRIGYWKETGLPINIRSLREGIDTSNATGRMIAGVLASLAELELELQRERKAASRAARKARGMPTGRPKALTKDKADLVRRMRDAGEPVPAIAQAVNTSRATVYRVLKESA